MATNNPRNNLDEQIRKRRAFLPWCIMNLPRFIQDVVGLAMARTKKGDLAPDRSFVELKVLHRPDIDSGFVYQLAWLSADGTWQAVRAANWELLLFRAAETELQARSEQTQRIEDIPGATPIQRVDNPNAKKPRRD